MTGSGVEGDSLQPLVVWSFREVLRDAGEVLHTHQRLSIDLGASSDVKADHTVGVLLDRIQLMAIATDGDPFEVFNTDEEGLFDRYAALQIEPENGFGVIADGVKSRAVVVRVSPDGSFSPRARSTMWCLLIRLRLSLASVIGTALKRCR